MTDAHLAELREIRRLLQTLVDSGAVPDITQQRLEPADRRALEVLLPAIHDAFAGDVWLVRDLFESTDTSLRAALQTVCLTPHQIGKLLKRVAGQHVDELVLERIDDTRDGWVYVTKTR